MSYTENKFTPKEYVPVETNRRDREFDQRAFGQPPVEGKQQQEQIQNESAESVVFDARQPSVQDAIQGMF